MSLTSTRHGGPEQIEGEASRTRRCCLGIASPPPQGRPPWWCRVNADSIRSEPVL